MRSVGATISASGFKRKANVMRFKGWKKTLLLIMILASISGCQLLPGRPKTKETAFDMGVVCKGAQCSMPKSTFLFLYEWAQRGVSCAN